MLFFEVISIFRDLPFNRLKTTFIPFLKGLIDGLNIYSTTKLIYRSGRIKQFLYNSIPLYAIYAIVNFVYHGLYSNNILPTHSHYTQLLISTLWWTLWFIPAYITIKIISYRYLTVLWNSVFEKQTTAKTKPKNKNKNKNKTPHSNDGWEYVGEIIYGTILGIAYTTQIFIIDWFIPIKIVSTIFSTISFAWAVSWAVFEYKMIREGHDLLQRIRYFERRWIYFLGFGLPLAILYRHIDWTTGISIWDLTIAFLTLNAILVIPIKSPKQQPAEHAQPANPTPKKPRGKPRSYDERRLRIFIFAEYISTYIVNWILNKQTIFNKYV